MDPCSEGGLEAGSAEITETRLVHGLALQRLYLIQDGFVVTDTHCTPSSGVLMQESADYRQFRRFRSVDRVQLWIHPGQLDRQIPEPSRNLDITAL